LYSGRIRSGDRMGTRVLLKVYNAPSSLSSGCDVFDFLVHIGAAMGLR
jgi:hypothetical protein